MNEFADLGMAFAGVMGTAFIVYNNKVLKKREKTGSHSAMWNTIL